MASTTRRASQRVTLLMLVLASVTILTLDYHGEVSRGISRVRRDVLDALAPVQRGIAAGLHPIGDVAAGAFHYGALVTQNARLRSELGAMQAQLAENHFAVSRAESVLALEGIPFVQNIVTTPAQVISSPTSNFADTMEIGRGTSAGVAPHMPVVSGRGLAGVVLDAGSSTAEIRLVTDPQSSIGVTFGTGTRASSAIAVGQGFGQPLVVDQIAGRPPHVGETIYTSGTDGGAYPAGIPVAVVASVRTGAGGLTTTATATPLVDLSALEYVAVLEWLPQP